MINYETETVMTVVLTGGREENMARVDLNMVLTPQHWDGTYLHNIMIIKSLGVGVSVSV